MWLARSRDLCPAIRRPFWPPGSGGAAVVRVALRRFWARGADGRPIVLGQSPAAAGRKGRGLASIAFAKLVDRGYKASLNPQSRQRAQVAAEPVGIGVAEEVVQPRVRGLPDRDRAGQQRPTRRRQRQPPAAPV